MALTKVPSNLDSITATTQSQGDGSTNVATTAYVDTGLNALIDSAPGNLNTLNELAAAMNDNASFFSTVLPLSGGTITGDVTLTGASADIVFDQSDNALEFATNAKAVFGSSLSISRIGNSSYIHETGSGDLYIKGSDIYITDQDNNQFIHLDDDGTGGTVRLKHEGSTKLSTTSTGVNVTGGVVASAVSQFTDVNIPDNNAIRVGSSQDLQIYHDGTNSHIYNNTGYTTLRTATASGYLYLHGDNVHLRGQSANEPMLTAVCNGPVQLYYDNSVKLETTTNGISVKGTSSNLITTSSTANDRAGAGFTATESATDGDRRAVMYLDADNGGFSTGNSGAYFYMEKIGGGGEVNFINQDTSGYNFRTGGSHKRMVIGSSGKTSWSAGGIGNAATQDRDFTFYTEGGSNGIDIRSNDYRNILLGSSGSTGSAMDAGYIGIYKDGSTKIALNASGNNFLNGGHLFVDNGVGVATFNTMDANGHTWQTDTYNTISAGSVSIGSDSSNSTHMWWNTYDTGSKYNVSPGYGMDMYHAKSTGEFVIRMGSVNAASAGASQTLVEAFKITKDRDVSIYAGRKLYLDGGSDTYIDEYSANEFGITTGGSRKLALSGGNLYHTGSLNSNHNFSDERLKDNIVVIPNALDKVNNLRGITFTRKDDGSVGTGLIAQELEKVLPEAVYESKTIDSLENPDAEEYKAINYGNTVGLLVEAIKELEARIKELEG